MANLGNVVGLLRSQTPPNKKYILWAKILNPAFPDIVELNYWDEVVGAWTPVTDPTTQHWLRPVLDNTLTAPPATPAEGDRYMVAAGATGAWAGKDDQIATYKNGAWVFQVPLDGFIVSVRTEANKLYDYRGTYGDGGAWAENDFQVPIAPGTYIPSTEKSAALGVATLGSDSKVPASQINGATLPYSPATPESYPPGIATIKAALDHIILKFGDQLTSSPKTASFEGDGVTQVFEIDVDADIQISAVFVGGQRYREDVHYTKDDVTRTVTFLGEPVPVGTGIDVEYFRGILIRDGEVVTAESIAEALTYTPADAAGLASHIADQGNPHGVTAAQIAETQTSDYRFVSDAEKRIWNRHTVRNPTGIKFIDDFQRASLGDNYTVVGSFSVANIQSNKLRLQYSSTAGWGNYVYRNTHFTSDLEATIEAVVEIVDLTPTNSGIGIRLHGGPTGRDYSFRLFLGSAGAVGLMHIQFSDTSTNQIAGDSYCVAGVGDVVKLTVTLSKNTVLFEAINLTTGRRGFVYKQFPIDFTELVTQPNRWYAGIQMYQGTYDITQLSLASNSTNNPDVLFLGDSLTIGYNNVDYDDVWYKKACENLRLSYSVIAGGGNTTDDLLSMISQAIDIAPKNVIILIGQNDINLSIPLATIQLNIESIVSQLQAEGINVILIANMPSTNADQNSLADWILSTYPNSCIDLHNPLRNGSVSSASANYILDGHWTQLGNDMAAVLVTSALKSMI